MADAGNIVVRISAKTDEFERAMSNVSGKLDSAGKSMAKAGKTLTKNVTAPIAAVGTAALVTVAGFDDSMSQVAAISGATGSDLERLRDMAKDMGAATRYSASEAADAMTYLALAGWDVNEIIGATPGMLDLAAAGGMDLARAADIVTDTMSAFGMEAKDAGKAANIFAAASSKSNTNVDQLGEAMKYASANANAAGMDLAQTAAVMGVLADSGIKGSQAGTTFNAMLRDMKSKAVDGKLAIGDMSVELYDQQGNMRDLGSVMADVEKATDGMTGAQKDAALAQIFGQEAMRGVNVMLETGSGRYKELEEALYGSEGAAKDMADVMEDNLAGAMRALKSKLEGILIQLGEQLVPIIRGVVIPALEKLGNLVSKMIAKFDKLSPTTKTIIIALTGLAAAAGPVLIALGALLGSVSKVSGSLKKLKGVFGGVTGATKIFNLTLLSNPIVWVIAGIAGLVTAIVLLWKNWDKVSAWLANSWDWIKEKVNIVFGPIADFLGGVWDTISSKVMEVWNTITNFLTEKWESILAVATPIFEGIATFLSAVWNIIKTVATAVWNVIAVVLSTIWNLILSIVMPIFEAIAEFLAATWSKIEDVVITVWTFIVDTLTSIWNSIMEFARPIFEGLRDFFVGIWEGIKEVTAAVWSKIEDVTITVWSAIVDFVGPIWETIREIASTVFGAIKDVITTVWGVISDITGTIWGVISDVLTRIWDMIKELAEGNFSSIGEIIDIVWSTVKDVTDIIWNGIKDLLSGIWNGIKSIASSVWEGIKTVIITPINIVKGLLSSAWDGIKSTASSVWNSIKSTASSVWNNIKSAIMNPINNAKNLLSNAWSDIKSTATNSWNSLVGTASSIFNKVKDAILKPFKNIHIPLPHFSFSTKKVSVAGKKFDIPDVKVNWYKKGGIFTQPSLIGVGEAGDEAVIPLSNKVLGELADKIVGRMDSTRAGGNIYQEIHIYSPEPLTPSETARQIKNASRQLALEL